ncbi:MAG TPA: hypothetical protein VNI77_00135 [Nitrososphaera sp.]|nr:hypothetical protein [Nitrososphaera sp.]
MVDALSKLKLLVVAAGVTAIVGLVAYNSSVFASHSFELGVSGNSVPDNTHIRLDGLILPPGGVLPVYDASPNFVSGHFLMRAPCDNNNVPLITVIGGHIDESAHGTFVDKIPLYYISHASGPNSCVYHAHVPDPLNGGAPRVTDIALVNRLGQNVAFNPGDMVDINVQRVLGSIAESPYEEMRLPVDITHGNPVYDLNDDNPDNDGLGFEHH